MPRTEFSKKVKLQAWVRCGGKCEKCGAKLKVTGGEYDHDIPCALEGLSTLDNCVVLCVQCHRGPGQKTAQDQKMISKADRVKAFHTGASKKRPWNTRWKKKLDGTVVPR